MPRYKLRRLFVLPVKVILALALVLGVLSVTGPWLMKNSIITLMQSQGVKVKDFDLGVVTPVGISLHNVEIENYGFEANRIYVGFSLREILEGKVQSVSISGGSLIDAPQAGGGSSGKSPGSGAGDKFKLTDLPVAEIKAELRLPIPETDHHLDIELELNRVSQGQFTGELKLHQKDTKFDGTAQISGRFENGLILADVNLLGHTHEIEFNDSYVRPMQFVGKASLKASPAEIVVNSPDVRLDVQGFKVAGVELQKPAVVSRDAYFKLNLRGKPSLDGQVSLDPTTLTLKSTSGPIVAQLQSVMASVKGPLDSVKGAIKVKTGEIRLSKQAKILAADLAMPLMAGNSDIIINKINLLAADRKVMVSGKVKPTKDLVRIEAKAVLGEQTLNFSGSYKPKTDSGSLTLAPMQLDFVPRGLQPTKLVAGLNKDLRAVKGKVDISGRINWSGSKIKPNVKLSTNHLSFDYNGTPILGLSTTVNLTSLDPLRISPFDLTVGKIDLDPPITRVTAKVTQSKAGVVKVSGLKGRWLGGDVGAAPFDVQISPFKTTIPIEFSALEFDQIGRQLDIDGLKVNGKLSGKTNISVVGDNYKIGKTKLEGGKGTLKYSPSQTPSALQGSSIEGKLALNILKDLRFEVVRVETSGGEINDNMKLNFFIRGKNPAIIEGHPAELNLTLSGPLGRIIRTRGHGDRIAEKVKIKAKRTQ